MPFVRRHRSYYKDGVEIPADTITDFGSYKYYKNIVTTKYWKEITISGEPELEYACYSSPYSAAWYGYAKAPIGSSQTLYTAPSRALASSSAELSVDSDFNWGYGVNESYGKDQIYNDWTRYTAGDLYIDTTTTTVVEGTPEDYTYTTEETVTVEVTAEDDYDFTEFVPSTQFDYYKDSNKLYTPVRKKRTYYKYEYKDFVQPILTANGVMGGSNFAVASNVAQYSGQGVYRLFDGSTSGCFHSTLGVTTGYIDLYNPKPLKITNILVNNQNAGGSENRASTSGNMYGSSNGSDWEQITSYTNTVQGINEQWNIDLSTNTKAYKYYRIESTAGGTGGHWTIGELTITAQELKAIGGTAEDADYYVDSNKLYTPALDEIKYYKHTYEDWEQPVLTSATSSKKVIITSTSDYDGGYANWRVFDGGSTPWLSGNGTGQGSIRMQFPRPLKISKISVTGWSNPNGGTANVTIYKDFNNTEVAGATQYFGGWVEKIWTFDTPILTDKLSFYITGTGMWGCASEINITAQEQLVTETTEEDAEWSKRIIKVY